MSNEALLDEVGTEPTPEMVGTYRTPSLRNIALSSPYMHGGHLDTLEEVVQFYIFLDEEPMLGERDSRLQPLDLSPRDAADLVAFLESLTGARPTKPSTPEVAMGRLIHRLALVAMVGMACRDDPGAAIYLKDSAEPASAAEDTSTWATTTTAEPTCPEPDESLKSARGRRLPHPATTFDMGCTDPTTCRATSTSFRFTKSPLAASKP